MRYKRIHGYVLILFLIISNAFNYSTSAKYRTEFEVSTETIIAGQCEVETSNIVVRHIDIETNDKLIEDEIIVKDINEEVIGARLKRDIEGYSFRESYPEKFVVSEENREIKLYYEKNGIIPGEKYVDVTIHHYLINSRDSIIEDEFLKEVKIGEVLASSDYIKEIEGYKFGFSLPQTLKVSETEYEIIIYYEDIKFVDPVEEVDVNIYFYDKDNNQIAVSEIVEKIKIGETLKGRDYVKEIEGYDFKYSFPEILEVREDNTVIKLYYDKKDVIEPVEYVDVTVNYLLENTTTSIIESKVLKDIKIGSIINGVDYKKDINDYTFVLAIPEKLEVSEENKVINLYYRKNETTSEDEFTNVTVNHLLTNTDTRVEESDILENIKIGTILSVKDYIKSIKGYEFDKVLVESLEIAKDNNVINIYYKKVDTSKPAEPENPANDNKPGSGNNQGGNDDLPETGGRNIIWLGYIFVLLGVIISSSKKEEYAE